MIDKVKEIKVGDFVFLQNVESGYTMHGVVRGFENDLVVLDLDGWDRGRLVVDPSILKKDPELGPTVCN
jgi:hypothetical protein